MLLPDGKSRFPWLCVSGLYLGDMLKETQRQGSSMVLGSGRCRRDPVPTDGQITRETGYCGAETIPVLNGGGFTVCTYMKSQN